MVLLWLFLSKWCWTIGVSCVLSHVQLFATVCTAGHQAPLSMGFSQQKSLQWVAISSSRGSSPPRDRIQVSCGFCIGKRTFFFFFFFFTAEPPGNHWYPYGKVWISTYNFHTVMNSKWNTGLKVKTKTIKLLDANIGGNF